MPRIIKMLARHGKPATFFVPGWTAEHYPRCMEAILESGHEIALHGYTHRPPCYNTPRGAARARSRRGSRRWRATASSRSGYRAPMWQTSRHTLEILGEYGIRYDSSLMDDDRPYLLDTPSGRLAEMCPQWYLDDWEQYVYVPDPDMGATINRPSVVAQLWIEELEGERETGSLLMLTCHPFASGRPGRIKAIERLIDFADSCGDVVFTRADELAQKLLAVPDVRAERRRPDDGRTDERRREHHGADHDARRGGAAEVRDERGLRRASSATRPRIARVESP